MTASFHTPSLNDVLRPVPWRDHPLLQRARVIAHGRGMTTEIFEREHLAAGGQPLVLTDAMAGWPALERWSFAYFRERYGDDELLANAPMFLEPDLGLEPVQVRMRLADYIDYVRDPRQPPRGEFTCGDQSTLTRQRLPLYAPVYRVLDLHPELAADVGASSLYCVDDLLARLPAAVRGFLDHVGSPVHYLFFGPPGSVAFLHTDYWSSHAYLAQLAGRKLALLFPPGDVAHLYEGTLRNPLAVDPERFPRFAQSSPHVTVLEPGTTLFVPAGWWHFVLGLTPSLTYSYNFFTRHNMEAYFSGLFGALAGLMVKPDGMTLEQRQALDTLAKALGNGN